MDDLTAHATIAFLTPLACALLVYPLAKRLRRDWVTLLIAAVFLAFVAMVLKELGDSQVSRNDIFADLSGLFFGTAVLAGLFGTSNAAMEKILRVSAVPSRGSPFGISPDGKGTTRREMSLREVLFLALKLAHFGVQFYQRAARRMQGHRARQLCLELARMEMRQAARLSDMLETWLPRPVRPSLVEWTQWFIERHDLYVRRFSSDASEADVLKYAIGCAEKMKRFYRHFRNAFPELWKRSHLEELVQAEEEHRHRLELLLAELRQR
ncbi:MAG: ferritin family protein [Candidatus Omnitrophica bacterium]|nr:ferritin family protein [Candidatus Omnitrophota bacterium]